MARNNKDRRTNALILFLGLGLIGGAVAFTLSKRDSGTTAPPTPCTSDVTGTCPDGSTITTQRCVGGVLQPTGNTCPTPNPTSVVSVYVVESTTGLPVQGVTVRFISPIETLTDSTDNNGNANVTIRVQPTGSTIAIEVSDPNYNNGNVVSSQCTVPSLSSVQCNDIRMTLTNVARFSQPIRFINSSLNASGNTMFSISVQNIGSASGVPWTQILTHNVIRASIGGGGSCVCPQPTSPSFQCYRGFNGIAPGTNWAVTYELQGDVRGQSIQIAYGHSIPPDNTGCSNITFIQDGTSNLII